MVGGPRYLQVLRGWRVIVDVYPSELAGLSRAQILHLYRSRRRVEPFDQHGRPFMLDGQERNG